MMEQATLLPRRTLLKFGIRTLQWEGSHFTNTEALAAMPASRTVAARTLPMMGEVFVAPRGLGTMRNPCVQLDSRG